MIRNPSLFESMIKTIGDNYQQFLQLECLIAHDPAAAQKRIADIRHDNAKVVFGWCNIGVRVHSFLKSIGR